MFSENTFTKNPPNWKYTQVIRDLYNKLSSAADDKERLKIYSEFSENYLMTRSLWDDRMDLEWNENVLDDHDKLSQEGLYKPEIFYNQHDAWEKIQKYLYPQKALRFYLMHLEENSNNPISKETIQHFEKMEKLYLKIQSVEENLEEWFECLKEANDHDFLRHNVEHRIGQNLKNKNIWKLYISYLRENNPKEMLRVYSKYCRFFLDDFEMKNEYKNAVEIFGGVYVPWKNLFEFECPESTLVIKEVDAEKVDEWLLPLDLPFFYEYSKKPNNVKQNLSLSSPLIQYLVNYARPLVYEKLQQTCKYFWHKKSKLHCYRFVHFNDWENNHKITFNEGSLRVTSATPSKMKPFENNKLVISMGLYFQNRNDNLCLSNFIKNYIFECDAKYIKISDQKLTEHELKFLIGRGNVESFCLFGTLIMDTEGEKQILLEDILKMLPRVRKFKISSLFKILAIPTSNKLCELKFHNKFIEFEIVDVMNEIDSIDFCNFVKKNFASNSNIDVKFHIDLTMRSETNKKLKKALNKVLEEWIPSNECPDIWWN